MAKVDYFLKIKGIPGESTKDKHKDEIEIQSWSWGETNAGSHASNTGGGAGAVVMNDFTFTMTVNKASPDLFLHCATGKHIDEALLTCREAGGKQQEYLKIKFTELLVSSYQTGGGNGADTIKPLETITFNFSRIDFSYAPQEKGDLKPYITKWYNVKETTSG